jgi:hypothetical protein
MFPLTRFASALIPLFFAMPAFAIDGEILIDQAKVNAGGITPGDAPGFPATLSRHGRYKLAGNLSVPAGFNGIEVTQHNVTIDLNGFTISSNPPGQAQYGVVAQDLNRLRVVGGTITGFGRYAIFNPYPGNFLTGPGGALAVEDMRIVSNGGGIRAETEARIRNSTIANNGEFGIVCASRCLIKQNITSGSRLEGVLASTASTSLGGGLVFGNAIVSNGGTGLFSAATPSTGHGNNLLFGNNNSGAQVAGSVVQLHPNVCQPACP